ncbi:flagellar brake protein [Halalkalibacter oceani]|uniref:flagellar brake protein n=1 Tax=Halalkalibacter oceani TaxID=1653776 RepID=UPI0033996611
MINIGSTIFLERKDCNEEEVETKFHCRLIDRDDNLLIVDELLSELTNTASIFKTGTAFDAWFIGRDEAKYVFETELVGRRKGNISMFCLKDPGKAGYKRIQRRNYARVEAAVNVALHFQADSKKRFVSVTADLSGGGCAIDIPKGKSLPEEGEVSLWFVLPMQSGEIDYVKGPAKIVRVFTPQPGAPERVSLQFTEMDDAERQKIIRYCFEKQLNMRRQKKEG